MGLGAGDALGVLHVMKVPQSLRKRMPGESKGVAALVQREVEHLKSLAASIRSQAASAPASTKVGTNFMPLARYTLQQVHHWTCPDVSD